MSRHRGVVPPHFNGARTDPFLRSAAGGRGRPRRHLPSWRCADRRPYLQDG
jgi:hypothetical protein